ncbi:MAG TPA: hypothetical protein PLG43_00305 [Spirochaetia bacterium]|nr:hypothetical protein [Spirochaetia bacterium]
MLKAGIAIVDISPEKGIGLAGYPHHPRLNTGIHDPLFASCLFLDNGKEKIEIICMDLVMYPKDSVKRVRNAIEKATGVPGRNIMICCSHTHSGPWASPQIDLDAVGSQIEPDPLYVEKLREKLIAIGIAAVQNTFDASIGIDRSFCGKEKGIGGNRRNPNEIADPEVWVIGVKDSTGALRVCLAKYALHPTFIHSDSFLVSADYPGYIRKHIAEAFPNAVFLFAQGTSGNQSPRFFRVGKTFSEAERAGRTIGDSVLEALAAMEYSNLVELGCLSEDVDIATRTLPPLPAAEAAVIKYKTLWEEKKRTSTVERDIWIAELKFLGAESTLAYTKLNAQGKTLPRMDDVLCEVQVFTIGGTRIVGLPGEIFVEFGLTIQYRAPFSKCFVIELSNGCLPGYACTAKAYAEGGYEAWTSMLSSESGDQLVDAAVRLLKNSAKGEMYEQQ